MIDSTDPHCYIVNLTNVNCNAQDVAVTLTSITDSQSNTLPAAQAVMGLLLGDVDGDGTVARADFTIARRVVGQTTNATNFRSDINVSGTIDRSDASTVRRQIGNSLP